MPLYRFDHASAVAEVAKLERKGEVVVAISHDDSGVYVATAKRTNKAETR